MRHLLIILAPFICLLFACNGGTETSTTNSLVDTPPKVEPKTEPQIIDKNVVSPTTYDSSSAQARINPDLIPPSSQDKEWTLLTEMNEEEFKATPIAELEMQLIHPIYSKIFDMDEDASQVLPLLSPGQKCLYYFRKMDETILEGGIEQFYKSPHADNYVDMLQVINLTGDDDFYAMNKEAATKYNAYRSLNVEGKEDLTPYFKQFNKEYHKKQARFYKKLEQYIKSHPEQFVRFTD